MTIVSRASASPASASQASASPAPASEAAPLLEVTVLHARDAAAATAGEADRLLFLAAPELGGRSPDLALFSSVLRETDLPVRVLVRGAEGAAAADVAAAMLPSAMKYLELGAEGLSFGFLDRHNGIDRGACERFSGELGGAPWTFHRGFDSVLEPRRAWRDLLGLPGLDAVASGGSIRGMASGRDELIAQVRSDPRIAALLIASGVLDAETVPWLIRAGVRKFGLAQEVRQDGSWTKAYVDASAVRAWRLLIDDAHQLALGVAAPGTG